MGLLSNLDLRDGKLPPWLKPLVELTKPMATTMTALVIPAGAFTVAMVAAWSPETATAMAEASTKFMQGIPESIIWLIGGILTSSFVSSSAEVIKTPPQTKRPKRPSEPQLPTE